MFDDCFVLSEYQRLFLGNHIGVSGGAGYIDDVQKSFILPMNITYIPFNTLIKPDVYCGGVYSYNWRDDIDNSDDHKPVFDEGSDICFEWGVGLTISPIFESISIGARLHAYTDFEDQTTKLYITVSAGYMF